MPSAQTVMVPTHVNALQDTDCLLTSERVTVSYFYQPISYFVTNL